MWGYYYVLVPFNEGPGGERGPHIRGRPLDGGRWLFSCAQGTYRQAPTELAMDGQSLRIWAAATGSAPFMQNSRPWARGAGQAPTKA